MLYRRYGRIHKVKAQMVLHSCPNTRMDFLKSHGLSQTPLFCLGDTHYTSDVVLVDGRLNSPTEIHYYMYFTFNPKKKHTYQSMFSVWWIINDESLASQAQYHNNPVASKPLPLCSLCNLSLEGGKYILSLLRRIPMPSVHGGWTLQEGQEMVKWLLGASRKM